MKQYNALTCRADRQTLDLIAAVGSTLPVTGMLDSDTSLTLYFDEGVFNFLMIDALRAWIPEEAAVEFEPAEIEEQNWNAEFERSLEPVRISEKLVITQSWNAVDATEGDLVVRIDPKMSFGTGHHESTRLIARLMTGLDFQEKQVLDIGTGTGVLAIIAAKLGAARSIAIDNNEWATGNAEENIRLNDVQGIDLRQCELGDVPEEGFDIVLANIHRNVIIELLPLMTAKLRQGPDSAILTSGVLIEDYDSLVDAAAACGVVPLADERENEWIATRFGWRS